MGLGAGCKQFVRCFDELLINKPISGEDREADADSDLEQNVTRLCQYLSGPSDLDECETESTPISSASGRCVSRKKKRSSRNCDRRFNSADTSSGCSDDIDLMASEVTELRQFPPTTDKPPLPPGNIYHKRIGKPVLPHGELDFLSVICCQYMYSIV